VRTVRAERGRGCRKRKRKMYRKRKRKGYSDVEIEKGSQKDRKERGR
jgi:hypothetical protein